MQNKKFIKINKNYFKNIQYHIDGGLLKKINNQYERLNCEQFILREGWRKTRDRLQKENPNAKIRYSYKSKQFTIEFGLPKDMKWAITQIDLEDVNIIK